MLVYCHTTTPRLGYVIDFIASFFGTDVVLTSDKRIYLQSGEARINYGSEPIAEPELLIRPHPLIFEKGIRPQSIDLFERGGCKAFFKIGGDLSFDLFSAIFYLISRYEEYLPHEKDRYNRYAHQNSIAYQGNFLKTPVVDLWLMELQRQLVQKFPGLQFPAKTFQWIPTYDIDHAWSFQNKGWWRNAGGMARDVLSINFSQVATRIKSLLRLQQDPYGSYRWLEALHRKHQLPAIFFFLVAGQRGGYDKNIDPHNKAFRDLVRQTLVQHTIGLHPSWRSGDEPALLKKEKSRLESITGSPVTASRQHFLRFGLPDTYRRLIAAGIRDDYSMGYGTINGFRASVARPFFWYDLERDEKTALRIHPFCFMDATAFYQEKLSPDAAANELQFFLDTVRSVQGVLYTIFHNHLLGTDAVFNGWQKVYEDFAAKGVSPL